LEPRIRIKRRRDLDPTGSVVHPNGRLVRCRPMSKRNRPTTAAQAAHRRRRHEQRSAYNSPENKAARAKAGQTSAGQTPPAAPTAKAPAPTSAQRPEKG